MSRPLLSHCSNLPPACVYYGCAGAPAAVGPRREALDLRAPAPLGRLARDRGRGRALVRGASAERVLGTGEPRNGGFEVMDIGCGDVGM